MYIGVPKEVKNNEARVAITPAGVDAFVRAGHQVVIEAGAGALSSFSDDEYVTAGATIGTVDEAWQAELVLKVKEPIETEYQYFRQGLVLFTYLHLAAEPSLTKALIDAGVTAIAYETVEVNRTLPLLTPMSEVAGRMSVQVGAQYLESIHGGMGILLSGIPGVERGHVTIIGGGVAGENAAKMAIGLGAHVTILDVSAPRLQELDDRYGSAIQTLMSNSYNIARTVAQSDLVIGAVLIPGAKAPKLVTEEMVQTMKKGAVLVDIAIDQGGIFETSTHVTTHDDPYYVKHGVLHYAVANMPGAVPRTSTIGLTNVTLPYALLLANVGVKQAITQNNALYKGVNVAGGFVTYEAVATALGYDYMPAEHVIQQVE
ncbi:alanine dehydrogenase [Caryophanon tenue]|uniref:Alanine dehydrogenase n=1 Tax=Caryophanon tenue TaxID=33978 RepID=A0A1C0Y6S6_9BACL|nr:alanine dehydrogenase [Caryophanon tenue]OCS82858.1 alanine dehydrogenase [Caryophanon tenue]